MRDFTTGPRVELTARELADAFETGDWLLVALPQAYEPIETVGGLWPRITCAEVSQDHKDRPMVAIEVEDRLGWLLGPEEVVTLKQRGGRHEA
jgi:hypothetical protein